MAGRASRPAGCGSRPEMVRSVGPYSSYEIENAQRVFIQYMSKNESAAMRKLKRKCQFAMFGPASGESFGSHDNVHFRIEHQDTSAPAVKPSGDIIPSAGPSEVQGDDGERKTMETTATDITSSLQVLSSNPLQQNPDMNTVNSTLATEPACVTLPEIPKQSDVFNSNARQCGNVENVQAKVSEPISTCKVTKSPSNASQMRQLNKQGNESSGKSGQNTPANQGNPTVNSQERGKDGLQSTVQNFQFVSPQKREGENTPANQGNPTVNSQERGKDSLQSTVQNFQFVSPQKRLGEDFQSNPKELLFGKPRKRGNECLLAAPENYPFGEPQPYSAGIDGSKIQSASSVGHPDTKLGIGEPKGKRARLDKTNLENCWRCDLCEVTDLDREKMLAHLSMNLHYSASLCKRDCRKTEVEAISLVSRAMLKHPPALYKSLVPVCPLTWCKSVFKDIYACSLHHSLTHGNPTVGDLYSVAEVELEEIVPYCDPNKCKCGEQFGKPKQLFSHWKQEKHFPFAQCHSGAFQIFCCCFCPKMFYGFMDTNLHVCNHAKILRCSTKVKKKDKDRVGDLKIKVLTLKKPDKPRLLLPDHSTARADVVVRESITQLKDLKRQSKSFGGGKSGKRKINKELKSLRQIQWVQNKKTDRYHVQH